MTTRKSKADKVQHSLTKINNRRSQNISARTINNRCLGAIRSSNKNYECNRCMNKFVYLSGLKRHKAKYHPDDVDDDAAELPTEVEFFAAAIKCTCCGAIFSNADQYVCHCVRFRRDELASPFCLVDDDMGNAILLDLKRIVAIGSAYMCEFCDTHFSDLPSLFHHESLHDPADGFSCDFCQLNLPTLEAILAHRVSKPGVYRRKNVGGFPNVPNVYRCNVCTEEFNVLYELYNHRYELKHFFPRQTAKQFQMRGLIDRCAICGYLSNNASELEEHLLENHTMHGSTTNANATNDSTTSDTGSSRKTPATKQEESKKLSRPYLCEKCGKTYTQSSHLFQHLRFHNGVRPFVCPRYACGRSFTIRPDLNDHIRKCHTGERPFRCEVCDKRFLTGSVYYQHRLIHRGERRYACPDCDKRFYRTDALKNHQRIHTGEKPFACDICNRTFRQRGDREKHVRVKHKKIIGVCSVY